LWQTCIQLLEKDFKIDANGARAFKGFFLKKLFLCGVETVKRFVNVHLHCNVSNLKNISNMIRTVARKSSIGQGGLNVCAGGLGAYFGGKAHQSSPVATRLNMMTLTPPLKKFLRTPMATFTLSASFEVWTSQATANHVRIEN